MSMKRSIAARMASEIVEYVPPFTSWWRAFTLSGGNRIVTRSDSDDIERPASPRFLSDVRMTSALFKHMSNRDFPGETPSGRKRRDRRQGDGTRRLQRPHPVVLRIMLDLGQMQGLQDRRNIHA